VNISEGRDPQLLKTIAARASSSLLDIHSDADHNRSVLTLGGNGVLESIRGVAIAAAESLDINSHIGVHPRIGVVDVVPFVPYGTGNRADLGEAVGARDDFAEWISKDLGIPCFLYGPERSLPDIRRQAWTTLLPDLGPQVAHPTAGACAVGARHPLVAYNVWLKTPDVELAKQIASSVRSPSVRSLGLVVGTQTQVSCNLVDPFSFGPDELFEAVSLDAESLGIEIDHCELVGLAPKQIVDSTDPGKWDLLDLSPQRTFESRIQTAVDRSGSPS
jgi:glutamate formiminotransferase